MNNLEKGSVKLFLFVLIVAFGCAKELPKASLVGTWKETNEVAGGCNSSSDNYKSPCTGNCNTVITATTIAFPNLSGNYTTTGNTIVFTASGSGSISITYELTASTLILAYKDSGDGCTYTLYYAKV